MKNTLIAIVLILLTSFSIYNYIHQNKKNYLAWVKAGEANAKKLADHNMNICNEVKNAEYFDQTDYLLIIFFEPTQCGSCLNEKTLWNEIANKKICPVLGITSLQDSLEFRDYMKQAGLNFPVLYDPTACIQRYLKIPDTPCKILINKNGEILFVDYVRKTDKSKESYAKHLKRFINEN